MLAALILFLIGINPKVVAIDLWRPLDFNSLLARKAIALPDQLQPLVAPQLMHL